MNPDGTTTKTHTKTVTKKKTRRKKTPAESAASNPNKLRGATRKARMKVLAQQLLDRTVAFLRKQQESCTVNNVCVYQHPDHPSEGCGLRPTLDMVGSPWLKTALLKVRATISQIVEQIPAVAQIIGDDNVELASALQRIHDKSPVSVWEDRFKTLAEDYGLTLAPWFGNDQVIFDAVVNFLRNQGGPNRAPGCEDAVCQYFNDTLPSRGCAARAVINLLPKKQQEEIRKSHNGSGFGAISHYFPGINNGMVSNFQSIHDVDPVMSWEDSFKNLAAKYNLKYAPHYDTRTF